MTSLIPATLGNAVAANVAGGLPFEALGVHAVVAGLASTWMIVLSKLGELTGNEENVSHLPPERKLPHDSDAKVAGGLFVAGAVVGLAVALALHFNQADAMQYWLASLGIGAVIGIIAPWPLVRGLGKEYLERARLNLEQGNFKEAMQDAAEVERISEVYKDEAISIKEYAREQRDKQIGSPAPQSVAVGQTSDNDDELSEFLSSYKPGSL